MRSLFLLPLTRYACWTVWLKLRAHRHRRFIIVLGAGERSQQIFGTGVVNEDTVRTVSARRRRGEVDPGGKAFASAWQHLNKKIMSTQRAKTGGDTWSALTQSFLLCRLLPSMFGNHDSQSTTTWSTILISDVWCLWRQLLWGYTWGGATL